MHKFGFSDSVLDVAKAVLDKIDKKKSEELDEARKMPRQLKDPKKETMMGYEYKPGKVRNQVVDKKDVKDKEKKGYIHTEEVDEDAIAEAMEMHLKPHPNGTHYTVHKVGKKLAAHGGIKVGERLSDTEVDDAKDSGIRVRHVKEDTDVEEGLAVVPKSDFRFHPMPPSGRRGVPTSKPVKKPAKSNPPSKPMSSPKAGPSGPVKEGLRPIPGASKSPTRDPKYAPGLVKKGLTKPGTISGRPVRSTPSGPVKEGLRPIPGASKSPTGRDARYAPGIVKKGLTKPGTISGRPVRSTPSGPVKEGAMKRMATQAQLGEPGSGLEGFKKRNAAKNNGGVAQGSSVNQDKPSNMGNLGKKQKSVPQNGTVNQNEEFINEKKAAKGKKTHKWWDDDGDGKGYEPHEVSGKFKKEAVEMKVKKTSGPDALGGQKLDASKECPTVNEGAGDEKTRSSAQGGQLAKHYYMMAKRAQSVGNKEAAGKYMAVAKKFYRKAEADGEKERAGQQKGAAEGYEPEDLGIAQTYFNEVELEEIEAAEDITEAKRKNSGAAVGETERSGHRVTKTEKEGPEHIVMQARKVVSLGHKHDGVEFADGSKAKVHPDHARAALSRYEAAKPAEKTEMQKHMAHSHGGFKHVASGKPLDHEDNPARKKSGGLKLQSTVRRTDRAVNKMVHPLDA